MQPGASGKGDTGGWSQGAPDTIASPELASLWNISTFPSQQSLYFFRKALYVFIKHFPNGTPMTSNSTHSIRLQDVSYQWATTTEHWTRKVTRILCCKEFEFSSLPHYVRMQWCLPALTLTNSVDLLRMRRFKDFYLMRISQVVIWSATTFRVKINNRHELFLFDCFTADRVPHFLVQNKSLKACLHHQWLLHASFFSCHFLLVISVPLNAPWASNPLWMLKPWPPSDPARVPPSLKRRAISNFDPCVWECGGNLGVSCISWWA